MDNINNIETYAKIIIGVIGAIVTFGKLRESFASIKRKQELKIDLEIFEKLKENKEFSSTEIEEKIKLKLKSAFKDNTENLNNFFIGIAVFVGFGFWSVSILKNNENFSGWIILTLFFTMVGLTMILGNNEVKKEEEVFYKISFYGKDSFKFGIIMSLITGILSPVLFWKLNGFSFWFFLSALFFFISIITLFKSIKRVR